MVKAHSPGCTQSICLAHTCKLCAHTHKITLRVAPYWKPLLLQTPWVGRNIINGFVSLWERAVNGSAIMCKQPELTRHQISHSITFFHHQAAASPTNQLLSTSRDRAGQMMPQTFNIPNLVDVFHIPECSFQWLPPFQPTAPYPTDTQLSEAGSLKDGM